jgi:PAN domain
MLLPLTLCMVNLLVLAIAADGGPSCATKTACSAVRATPKPVGARCGDRGRIKPVKGAVITDTTNHGSTPAQCALRCRKDHSCQSFAFSNDVQRCRTFRNTITGMGFQAAASSPVQFWHRSCWTDHCQTTQSCSSTPASTPPAASTNTLPTTAPASGWRLNDPNSSD